MEKVLCHPGAERMRRMVARMSGEEIRIKAKGKRRKHTQTAKIRTLLAVAAVQASFKTARISREKRSTSQGPQKGRCKAREACSVPNTNAKAHETVARVRHSLQITMRP